jgi:hypothetical protein
MSRGSGAMDHPPKTSKRIVSKEQYLVNTGKKATLSSFGAVVVLFGILGAVISCMTFIPMFRDDQHWSSLWPFLLAVVFIGCAGSLGLLYMGGKAIKEGIEIDAGVPLTRANTADLPAADSLVRASEQPLEEQQAILLRAATSGTDTPAEELVRASVGPQNTES